MKNKYSDGSLSRYIEYFVFRHVFLHEQVFMGKFVLSPLTYLPWTTKQTKMAAWWATMSLFRFGFTRKSLDTVTKSEDIQATQQLNSTKLKESGDKRKAESQPEVFAGKSKRDRKYQTSWERNFPWLVHDEEKNTMKCKICCSFPEIADNSSSLFIGNGAFRHTTIQAHAKSKTHFKCTIWPLAWDLC